MFAELGENMENEFINMLDDNEKILFHGISDVSKTSKQYGRFIVIFFVLLMFWWILITTWVENDFILNIKFLILFFCLFILTILLVYGLIYNMFFKYRSKNNEYFITDKRIALYNSENGFKIENISNIEHIGISREKNNYGDVIFNFYADNLVNQMKNGMSFEGIENPRMVVGLICEINNNVHIYDDRPTLFGRKM